MSTSLARQFSPPIMEERFKLLEIIREGNIMGRIWRVSYFDKDGMDVGTTIEIELVTRASGMHTFRCVRDEIMDCMEVLNRAYLFVQKMKKQEAEEITS